MKFKAQIDIVWLYRFFLIILVTLGLLLLVGRYKSIELNRKPLKAASILNLIYYCKEENLSNCINVDSSFFISYKQENYGNIALKTLCESKEKNVELKEDIFCLKTQIYKDKKFEEIFIGIK
ncbi:MAG: hypothetical protein QXQ30_01180 [Candidatus Pacearchaeota archaeon]